MKITATIIGANQWTPEMELPAGYFDLSVSGTFVATVTVQRSLDGGVIWGDCASFTAPTEDTGLEGAGARYRVGCKTAEFTSGSINISVLV